MFLKYLTIFFISMVPIVELRGAIPVAVGMGMQGWELFCAYVIAVIGKFFTWCYNKGEKGGQKLNAKAGKGIFIALMLFVGIPLPGTGAWTGTLAASFLDVGFKKSSIAVMCGVLIAGVIMGAASLAVSMGAGGIFSCLAPK